MAREELEGVTAAQNLKINEIASNSLKTDKQNTSPNMQELQKLVSSLQNQLQATENNKKMLHIIRNRLLKKMNSLRGRGQCTQSAI